MKRKGSTTSIVIATIAGLSVLGVAGYRMMSGDCSTCPISGTEVSAQTVSTTESAGGSCCALMAGSESTATLAATETDGESCTGEKACGMETSCSGDAAKAQLVSTAAEGSCSGESACTDKGAEVEMISTTTEHADECGHECAGDACGKDADECCGKCEAGKELAKAPE